MRSLYAAKVVELVGLAEANESWGRRCALNEGDSLRSDRVVDGLTPLGELRGREVLREHGHILLHHGGSRSREDRNHSEEHHSESEESSHLGLHRELRSVPEYGSHTVCCWHTLGCDLLDLSRFHAQAVRKEGATC